jgi:hypothetical protein
MDAENASVVTLICRLCETPMTFQSQEFVDGREKHAFHCENCSILETIEVSIPMAPAA